MINIPANTWALVADGARARTFRVGRKAGDIEELHNMRSKEAGKPSRDLDSDARSRSRHLAGSPGSHTKERRTDPHDQAERAFARALLQRLERAARSGRFEGLVIAADPRTLGALRQDMSKALSGRVLRELDVDLTWMAENEIDARIRKTFALR
jgi:protein required for attachment to host cells